MKKTGASLQDTAIEFNMNNLNFIQRGRSFGRKKEGQSKKLNIKFVKQNQSLSCEK